MRERAAGILLHPTSLPGPFGVGDFGPQAERFLDWAAMAGQGVWQVLPLGPPAEYGSPYGCLSTFAGNPLLISPERLREDGLLAAHELLDLPAIADETTVPYGSVEPFKEALLRRAWERFHSGAAPELHEELAAFVNHPDQRFWLQDWTLFSSLRQRFGQRPWNEWPEPVAQRRPEALERARAELASERAYHAFVQLLFARQWRHLRQEAAHRGIRILGDLPIYVAYDSAEVWAHRELFDLDDEGRPNAVAGVPPDAFTTDGQLWGNPLYRWDRLAEDDYRWWVERLAAQLRQTDLVRLDHFRGFAGYWRVPAGAPTAAAGAWEPGPGLPLFEAMKRRLGELPLIAEDLGVITEDVDELRHALGLPGMRVLQFAFGEDDSLHAPHRHEPLTAVYTGTHDNQTTAGWYQGSSAESRERLDAYLGPGPAERARSIHWEMICLAYTSAADLAVIPLQDVLGLGDRARMNTPGRAEGNWAWRLRPTDLREAEARRLERLARLTGRRAATD